MPPWTLLLDRAENISIPFSFAGANMSGWHGTHGRPGSRSFLCLCPRPKAERCQEGRTGRRESIGWERRTATTRVGRWSDSTANFRCCCSSRQALGISRLLRSRSANFVRLCLPSRSCPPCSRRLMRDSGLSKRRSANSDRLCLPSRSCSYPAFSRAKKHPVESRSH